MSDKDAAEVSVVNSHVSYKRQCKKQRETDSKRPEATERDSKRQSERAERVRERECKKRKCM